MVAQRMRVRGAERGLRCDGHHGVGTRRHLQASDLQEASTPRLFFTWGKQCGQKAADTYCRAQGYERATHFDTEPARPTRLASDGRVCDADFCVAFKSVTCFTSASERGRTGNWPQRID